MIVFSEKDRAHAVIDQMRSIHSAVENARKATIPDWAYRDVLYMLIHYSIASFELLERKLSDSEKQEVYEVFYRVGSRMGLRELPPDYQTWLPSRDQHLKQDLQKSTYTTDLFKQYKKHLGAFRYQILLQSQQLVVPGIVCQQLGLGKISLLTPLIPLYKLSRKLKVDWFLVSILLPGKYKAQIKALNIPANSKE